MVIIKRMNSGKRKRVRTYLRKRDGSYCALCYIYLSTGNATIDHIIPLSLGGSHNLNNLQLLCIDCNIKKGNSIIVT